MPIRRRWSAILLSAAFMLPGCGKDANREKWVDRLPLPMDTLTVPMDELGRHGGHFTMGATTSPKTFNPITGGETSSSEIANLLFVTLTDVNARTSADKPGLARSWDISPDGRTVTFHLRRGACFSDGHPLTSDDVRFSFDVTTTPAIASPAASALSMDVDGKPVLFTWSAPDSYTFVLTTPRPDALVLTHAGLVRIIPRHVLQPAFNAGTFESAYGISTPPESLVCSGPFRLEAFENGQRTVLGRNPYWYGVDAKGARLPYLDRVIVSVSPDQTTAALKFESGELDGLDNVKPEDARSLEAGQRQKGYVLLDVGPSLNSSYFFFNLNRVRESGDGRKAGDPYVERYKFAWFSNREFRRAISHAIDRTALIDGPMAGQGVPGWSVMTPSAPLWYDSTITGADFDLAKAKSMLDGLGLVDRNGDGVREDAQGRPVSFSLMYNSDNRLRGAIATLLQNDLASVGVKLVPTGIDFNTLLAHQRNDFQYEAILGGLGSGSPADPGLAANFWKYTGATHHWDMRQPEGKPDTPAEGRMAAVFDEHVSTLDMAKRKATFREMSTILNEECFVVWLPTSRMKVGVRERFGNFVPTPLPPRILGSAGQMFERTPR